MRQKWDVEWPKKERKKEIGRLGVNLDGVGEEEGKREKEKGKENSLKTTWQET